MPRRSAHRRWSLVAFALSVSVLSLSASAPAAAPVPTVILTAATPATELSIGTALPVTGTLSEAGHGLADVPLALQADAYPYAGFRTVAQTATAPDGSYEFSGPPADRNVRLRVIREAPGTPSVSSETIDVFVDPLATLHVRNLGRGRTQLTLRLKHTERGGSTGPAQASWFVAAPGTRVFRLLARTQTRELSPGLTYASAVIDPPSKRFIYRVCLNPGWERAMGAAAGHGHCPRGDYTVGHDVG